MTYFFLSNHERRQVFNSALHHHPSFRISKRSHVAFMCPLPFRLPCSTDLDLQNDVLASRGPGAGICTLGITCKDGKLHEGTAAKIHCIGTAHAKTLRKNS